MDAPLDDQNIGRFVKMLNDFKSRTQFIVITHNPRTTSEAADAVYGVTMQEPGVSSIVSVRLRGGQQVDETIVPDDGVAGAINGDGDGDADNHGATASGTEPAEDSAADPSPA